MYDLYKKILEMRYFPKLIKIAMIIGINWTFQSIFHMEKTEKIFKLGLTLFLSLTSCFLLRPFLSIYARLFLSFAIAHTINWAINGHVFALLRTFNIIKDEQERFTEYLDDLRKRVVKEKSILVAAAFGSLSRGELKETSDLDVRIIRKKGLINGFRGCLFVLLERTRAFFSKFPLDIYLLDDVNQIKKQIRPDEPPSIIYDPVNVLS